MLFGYFHWDPDRAMFDFNIPFLNRPILWYGFLFALGVFIAYWILVYLLHRYFLYHSAVCAADVREWTQLVEKLKNRKREKALYQQLFAHCSPNVQQQIDQMIPGAQIPSPLKEEILESIPLFLQVQKKEVVSHKSKEAQWARKYFPKEVQLQLENRLLFKNRIGSCLRTLRQRTKDIAEKLTLYVVVGTLAGARLGDVLFYQGWKVLLHDPFSLVRIWEGGLASHGGALGILCALALFSRTVKRDYPFFSWKRVVDLVSIPATCAAVCIRIGNFFNQEILGKPTTVPWAVIFGHPIDGRPVVPRHPVQIYEAVAYLCVFFLLFSFWKKKPWQRTEGKIAGLFFLLVFGSRFCLEFFKEEQSVYLKYFTALSMGQMLSIPFFFLGLWLFFYEKRVVHKESLLT